MRGLADSSVDAVVTDPPYELGFMGKRWDASGVAYDVELWREALRVAKPGAHLLAFGGSRTYHRLTCAIEDAGWEVRDSIMWLYGSGFPKSHNGPWGGTALKPAHEPIVVARKPLDGTVAANVLAWGTGALNVDGCRVGTEDNLNGGAYSAERKPSASEWGTIHRSTGLEYKQPLGRWPANVIHDGSEEVTAGMGDAARFFYCAKASKRDRDEGCEGLEERERDAKYGSVQDSRPHTPEGYEYHRKPRRNHHPTVKPTDLMRYLVRLVTPPDGLVLDPFTGSGSTGKACALEGFRFLGIEQSPEYAGIARARIAAVSGDLFASVGA